MDHRSPNFSPASALRSSPMLRNDLRIVNCDDCAACCMNEGYPMFNSDVVDGELDPRWDSVPEELKREFVVYVDRWPAQGKSIVQPT